MTMTNLSSLYGLSRTVHRIFVTVMLTFIVLMGGTGLGMKYPGFADFLHLNQGLIRDVHNLLSVWFAVTLSVMAVTGSFMYLYPWYLKRKTLAGMKSTTPPSSR